MPRTIEQSARLAVGIVQQIINSAIRCHEQVDRIRIELAAKSDDEQIIEDASDDDDTIAHLKMADVAVRALEQRLSNISST